MPAWFDIESLENLEEVGLNVKSVQLINNNDHDDQETDIEGVRASAELVYKHIDVSFFCLHVLPLWSILFDFKTSKTCSGSIVFLTHFIRWSDELASQAIRLL